MVCGLLGEGATTSACSFDSFARFTRTVRFIALCNDTSNGLFVRRRHREPRTEISVLLILTIDDGFRGARTHRQGFQVLDSFRPGVFECGAGRGGEWFARKTFVSKPIN